MWLHRFKRRAVFCLYPIYRRRKLLYRIPKAIKALIWRLAIMQMIMFSCLQYEYSAMCYLCTRQWSRSWSPVNSGQTRQIWGIWKLRPAYSPEMPNLAQNQWCFVSCDLEIWWMTLENNRASLLCCFKLCATFHSHWWIQTEVTVRKRPIWIKLDNF